MAIQHLKMEELHRSKSDALMDDYLLRLEEAKTKTEDREVVKALERLDTELNRALREVKLSQVRHSLREGRRAHAPGLIQFTDSCWRRRPVGGLGGRGAEETGPVR